MLNKNKGSSHSSIMICLDIWLTAEKTLIFQVDNIFAHQLHLGYNGLYELNSTEL